jgi:hypothetical protein
MGPSLSEKPPPDTRVWSSSQIISSDHVSGSVAGSHWKYIRCSCSVRWLMSANPRSCRAYTSSGALIGASVMMPNHANGYSLKYCVLSDSGISWRQMLCEPSAPTR